MVCSVYAQLIPNPKFKVASALVLTDNLDSVYSPSVPRGTSNRWQLSACQLYPPPSSKTVLTLPNQVRICLARLPAGDPHLPRLPRLLPPAHILLSGAVTKDPIVGALMLVVKVNNMLRAFVFSL